MLDRAFRSYAETVKILGIDPETLRQNLLGGCLKVYIEIDSWNADCELHSGGEVRKGSNKFASWERLNSENQKAEWILQGWFEVLRPSLTDALRARGFVSPPYGMPYVEIWPWGKPAPKADSSKSNQPNSFLIDAKYAASAVPTLENLWFDSSDVASFAKSRKMEITDKKPLQTRERATLLAIISALAKLANLDLTEHYKAGGVVAAKMQEKGSRYSEHTVANHLKAARDLNE